MPLFKGWYAMYDQYAKNKDLLHGSNTKKGYFTSSRWSKIVGGLKCNIGDSV